MKELKNDIIKKYKYYDYVVYVKDIDGCYEFYLQKEKDGIMNFMFGLLKKDQTLEQALIIVKYNIDEYIDIYKEED